MHRLLFPVAALSRGKPGRARQHEIFSLVYPRFGHPRGPVLPNDTDPETDADGTRSSKEAILAAHAHLARSNWHNCSRSAGWTALLIYMAGWRRCARGWIAGHRLETFSRHLFLSPGPAQDSLCIRTVTPHRQPCPTPTATPELLLKCMVRLRAQQIVWAVSLITRYPHTPPPPSRALRLHYHGC